MLVAMLTHDNTLSNTYIARSLAFQSQISRERLKDSAPIAVVDNGTFILVFLNNEKFRYFKGSGYLCSYSTYAWKGYSKTPTWSEAPCDFSKFFQMIRLKKSDFNEAIDENSGNRNNDRKEPSLLLRTFWRKNTSVHLNPTTCIKFAFSQNGAFEALYWYPEIYKGAEQLQKNWDRAHPDVADSTVDLFRGKVSEAIKLVGDNPYMKGDQDLVTGTLTIKK